VAIDDGAFREAFAAQYDGRLHGRPHGDDPAAQRMSVVVDGLRVRVSVQVVPRSPEPLILATP
jgi:hypothetical protein